MTTPSESLASIQRLTVIIGGTLLLLTAACGGAPLPEIAASDTGDAAGDGEAIDAALPDGGSFDGAATDASTPGDGASDAAPTPVDAAADAPADPCASFSAIVARCQALVGTSRIGATDVTSCIDAMTLLRTPSAASCLSDAQRTAFDATALGVLTSAMSLTQAACDSVSLQTRLAWIERYVHTARSLAGPPESVDHAKLNQIDAAFWDGVYWGDPRAAAFDRSTLRTMRPDALDCAHAVLDAAFTPATSTSALPLTTAPLAGVTSEALSALAEGYERTTVAHEFACEFAVCMSPELPGAAKTWSALAVLDDASALASALGSSGSPAAVWASSLQRFASQHASFEASVVDALGASAYSPALLSDPSASDLPSFAALVATRDRARALVTAQASTGSYLVGPGNDLHTYPDQPNFEQPVHDDLAAQVTSVQAASSAAGAAQSAFQAGTQAAYDLRPFETAAETALQWSVANALPVVRLRAPQAFATLTAREQADPAGLQPVLDLASYADAPLPFDVQVPSGGGWVESYANAALGALTDVSVSFVPMTPDAVAKVAVSFPNPAYSPAPGEAPIPWQQADATRSKAVWNLIGSKGTGTLTVLPDDLYAKAGGESVLLCSVAGLVVRGLGLLIEYPSGAVLPGPTGASLELAFTASPSEPYLTDSAQLESFTSEMVWDQSGSLPAAFSVETAGWAAGNPLVAAARASGASPFTPFTVDFSALGRAIASTTSVPRTLTVMMSVESGPLQEGSLASVKGCGP